MKKPAAILFDWDNTLIDTFPLLMAAHNKVREHLGVALWSEDEARHNIRLAAKDAFPKWYGERAKDAFQVFDAHVRLHHLAEMDILDGTRELLDRIQALGVPMAIVSNKRGEFLRAEVAHAGWTHYFPVLIGADDITGPGKPSPEGVLAALEKLSIPAPLRKNCWYVGDTENDIKTANSAGLIPVFIENRSMQNLAKIRALQAKLSFKNARECLAYVTKLS